MTDIKLSSSLEDYLETIYNYLQDNEKIRAVDISRELNVSRASVSEALQKLGDLNLVNYGRYESLSLTTEGKNYAESVINKHKSIQVFFEKILGADYAEACQTACKMEHVISQNILERLVAFTEFTKSRPEIYQEFEAFYKDKNKHEYPESNRQIS